MMVPEGIFTQLAKEKYPANQQYYIDMANTCAISGNELFRIHLSMAARGMAYSNGPITESDMSSKSGCFGCRYRKMNKCAVGRKEYPDGGPGFCLDTRKRPGFRKSEATNGN